MKNTIFAFPKTFTIFYLRIYYFKVKVRLILTLIVVILGNAEIADWVLSNGSLAQMFAPGGGWVGDPTKKNPFFSGPTKSVVVIIVCGLFFLIV